MSVIPCYAIGIVIIVYSIFVYSPFIPSLFTYVITKNHSQTSNKQRNAALEYLVDAPTIGQFFYQELITNCMLQNKWEKVLNYSNHALQYPINKNSFTIWYYKATAQCLLSLPDECQRSARIANGLFPVGHQQYVSQLFSLVKVIKGKKNLKMVTSDNQIMIVVDSTQSEAGAKPLNKGQSKQTSQAQKKSQQKQDLKQFIASKQGQEEIMKTLNQIFPEGVINQISQIKQMEIIDPTTQPQALEEQLQQKLDEVNLSQL